METLLQKFFLPLTIAVGLLSGGCASSPVYDWYHPAGGEYLFAYDRDQCEADVVSRGETLGTDFQGPFFSCMYQRGYYLVDGGRLIAGPVLTDAPDVPTASAN